MNYCTEIYNVHGCQFPTQIMENSVGQSEARLEAETSVEERSFKSRVLSSDVSRESHASILVSSSHKCYYVPLNDVKVIIARVKDILSDLAANISHPSANDTHDYISSVACSRLPDAPATCPQSSQISSKTNYMLRT